MKSIEKKISQFVENQFPEFYKEDGEIFIAFLKSYYEWLEQENKALYEARSLPDYKDIDTTLDEFIVYFKEKYLKNIQFDTATNKILLIKNALNLYRSKGTERSIDLFFKLIYGTDADVSYPADNILRISDGVWEKPFYLEISSSKYNIEYVGKQIIGSLSNATAFVERYIRRKTNRGYVNLLYVSGIKGNFRNGEVIGMNINSTPSYDLDKRAKLIGSVSSVIIIDKGRGFNVGDLVSFNSDSRGIGGIARVESVSNATGVIDFIFEDGGWGYTLNAEALISEKVVECSNVNPQLDGTQTFRLFETIAQPLVNVSFTSATANVIPGQIVTRYVSGVPTTTGRVVEVTQNDANGTITIAHIGGAFTNGTFYSPSNTMSFQVTDTENRTVIGTVMGIPTVYKLTTTGQSGDLNVGDLVTQKTSDTIVASGYISDIDGNVLTIANTRGSFKKSVEAENFYYKVETGTISASISNNIVTGVGTLFNNNYINTTIFSNANVALGKVISVSNSTTLTLAGTAAATVTGVSHATSYKFPLTVDTSGSSANITHISTSLGVYQIQKYHAELEYSGANNANILNTTTLYQYNSLGAEKAKALLMTGDYNAGSGNVTVIPLHGKFDEGEPFFTEGNTATATLIQYNTVPEGGDFIASPYSRMHTVTSNSYFFPISLSFGSGADFNVGSIGDPETIFIGTDLLGANNKEYVNFGRRTLSIGSNSGFSIGSYVSQEVNKIAFNSNTALNAVTGFITLPAGANTKFITGENIRYATATGNTPLEANGTMLHVYFANNTGVILSHVFNKEIPLNSVNYPNFANGALSETGHFLYKIASGKVFEVGSGLIRVKDTYNDFGNTGGGANTTQYGNGNVVVYGSSTNTAISNISEYSSVVVANQAYMTIPVAADGYGFPKNTQGDIKDIIYSTLTFNSFTIGTIGSLTGVDPGSDYNVDPYVLAYQPYIASFNRKDFVIHIENPTGAYIVGEKVNQTLANLVYYDLQVDSGVYTNTYVEETYAINTQYDVNSANDFIYVTSQTKSFNANTDVEDTDDFINITNNTLLDGDYIRYYTAAGNTVLSGLANNGYYFVVQSNTSGIKLSTTNGGGDISITPGITESGHYLVGYRSNAANNDKLLYQVPAGNTAISGLSDDSIYYVVNSNTSGFSLALTQGGSVINLTANNTGGELQTLSTVAGFLPNERIYQGFNQTFNGNTNIVANSIVLTPQPFGLGDLIHYYTNSGNTVISGLANNTSYYVVSANSTAIKLSNSVGGSPIALSSGPTETGQNLTSSANATIKFVYKDGANSYIRIQNKQNTFAVGHDIYSYTNPYVTANVLNIAMVSTTSTAKGVVKPGSNSSVLFIKRLTFENTFVPGQAILGDVSGTSSTLVSVAEDDGTLYPIGLNANISANVITANGQINSLQVIDSGFGFTNSEIVQYTSDNGLRSGSIRVIVDGYGRGKGYYRSSKGFLSDSMYIHDGDYYQEYSYEILSKMSLDKYSSMFKQVMHVAGTKFFGSVRVIEDANVKLTYADSSIVQS